MDKSILKMFAIFGVVSVWADKALSDGKVTLKASDSLSDQLAVILGIPTEGELENSPSKPESPVTKDEYGKDI